MWCYYKGLNLLIVSCDYSLPYNNIFVCFYIIDVMHETKACFSFIYTRIAYCLAVFTYYLSVFTYYLAIFTYYLEYLVAVRAKVGEMVSSLVYVKGHVLCPGVGGGGSKILYNVVWVLVSFHIRVLHRKQIIL